MKNLSQLYIELGNLLKQKIGKRRLSLDEIAYRCELHINYIWKIAKTKGEIKLSTLIRIFSELNIDFSAIQKLLNN